MTVSPWHRQTTIFVLHFSLYFLVLSWLRVQTAAETFPAAREEAVIANPVMGRVCHYPLRRSYNNVCVMLWLLKENSGKFQWWG